MPERVVTEIVANVATVTLNRAEKRNAADIAMFQSLIDTAAALVADSGVRVVVLRGAGGNFCTGIDISLFAGEDSRADLMQRMHAEPGSDANFLQKAATVWRDLPVPVIVVLDGMTFGAGVQIAMGADIRIAAPDVQMSIMEIKWGIIPDMGITMTLPGVVAQDKVRQLAYTGRIMTADDALNLGMVTEIAEDPHAAAQKLAAEIAARSPEAIRAIKTLINTAWKEDPSSGLRREAELQMAIMSGANFDEAVRANMEKRSPEFDDSY